MSKAARLLDILERKLPIRPMGRKISYSDVKSIRDLHNKGVPQVDICKKFDVDKSTVSRIISGGLW